MSAPADNAWIIRAAVLASAILATLMTVAIAAVSCSGAA